MHLLPVESQLLRDYILCAASHHQRLRYTAQRRKAETFPAPQDTASGEINVELFPWNDGCFFCRDLAGKLFSQPLDQRRDLDAQKPVVIGVPQVSLRKA